MSGDLDRWHEVSAEDEAEIREDERHRLARLLEENADTLSSFSGGTGNTVKLVAFMLRLRRQ